MRFTIPKAMSGSRLRPTPARILGLLALLTIPLLAACGGEASPAPASTPAQEAAAAPTATPPPQATVVPTATPAPEATTTPTATRAPEPTPAQQATLVPTATPEPMVARPASADSSPTPDAWTYTPTEVEAVFASDDWRWRDLFDVLGAAEQACIRENLGEDLVDEILTRRHGPYLAHEERALILRCLPPDLADSVFLASLWLDLDPDHMGVEVTAEGGRCVEDLVEPLDTAALMEMLGAEAPSAEAAAFFGNVFRCIPDLLIADAIVIAGGPVGDLDDDAVECMREAVPGIIDRLVLALVSGEEVDGVTHYRTIYECAPDIYGAGTPEHVANAKRTVALVEGAGARWLMRGREDTLAYYSSPEHVVGPWYVFIIGEDGRIAAHYIPELVGADANELVDSEGYAYGPELLKASETGRWVSYVHLNPETGEEQTKHTWVVRLDGLIFGSGWYE